MHNTRARRGHASRGAGCLRVDVRAASGVLGLCFRPTACDSTVVKVPTHGEPLSTPGHWESLATQARSCCLCPRKGRGRGGGLRPRRPSARLQLPVSTAWQLAHARLLAEQPARMAPELTRRGGAVAMEMLSLNLPVSWLAACAPIRPPRRIGGPAPGQWRWKADPKGRVSLSLCCEGGRSSWSVWPQAAPGACHLGRPFPSCRHPWGLTRTIAGACR